MADVSGIRRPYHNKNEIFDVKDLVAREPFAQFEAWFEEARKTPGIDEPNAMAIASATRDGCPSVRMVLMKHIDKQGVVFYTNYGSRKAKELVRIEGKVERVPEEESDHYFHERPRASQIGALVSQNQSSVVPSREALDKRNAELQDMYAEESKIIPKPDYWGGYRVVPSVFEFWQGQTNRLHDRLRFRKPSSGEKINPELTQTGDDGWLLERLSP
ncbi:hypothetical protein BaRGS_00013771 [Batillaria attramentaria]|uniref:pyridoxal 5'-phosphate synthase n=1 Tax=Batillaria attramentaria TaxID=370345 RepID=A0ABD0L6W4_9CAEN